MYIIFELTDTSMIFTYKDEAGTTIGTPATYPLDTYESDPVDKIGNCGCDIIIRTIGSPLRIWPPVATYPRGITHFKNTTSGPFQIENESAPVET